MSAFEWLNHYGPIAWAFAAALTAIGLALVALVVAHIRYRLILRSITPGKP